jgi:hypothetical protein
VSACGGSSGNGVAEVPTAAATPDSSASPSGSGDGDPAAYSACMRRNGVPNFPDPDSQGRLRITSGVRNGQRFGVDVNSPQFRKAQHTCERLQPKGGRPSPQEQEREREQMLKFSQCMRSHGVPKYPDPTFMPNGGSQMTIGKSSGIDPGSPQFRAAQKACQELVPNGPVAAGPGDAQ